MFIPESQAGACESTLAMKRAFLGLAIIACLAVPSVAQQIPDGTLLPVKLNNTIKAGKTRTGERVLGKLMQPVRLPDGRNLPVGTAIMGRVLEVRPASSGSGSRVVLVFENAQVDRRTIPISVSLRALASMTAVFDAQLPTNLIDDYGSTVSDWNTVQVGGQAVYRGAGIVMSGPEIVGRASDTGLVTAMPAPAKGSPCSRETAANQREQAFWVFSSNACGTYGFDDLTIEHAGRSRPIGQIALASRGNLDVRGGSGWLLTVVAFGEMPRGPQSR